MTTDHLAARLAAIEETLKSLEGRIAALAERLTRLETGVRLAARAVAYGIPAALTLARLVWEVLR